ncbi:MULTISPECIES: vanadium-dependent haloperoxidase [unclassified Janthinobacterium]|uniref:vanadium-dependent haloperoxidase n=1 Tax=unclassified Janthinobacterium TaxID=2610881 RepID=UPI000349BD54|nr:MULTISPECIES: vanadium-dependent haloperoxidase [unclassified Janthinobacterium]MEC5159816.1 hypothetical protein [Janthinobacterium sp. CG_S6]
MRDPILFWNEISLEADRRSHTNNQGEQRGPTLSSRALAIVHLAMYDAYAGVVNNQKLLPSYMGCSPLGAKLSAELAVSAAAHRTLSVLYPSQTEFFDAILAKEDDKKLDDKSRDSYKFGNEVACSILEDRLGDPDAAAGSYKPATGPGKHRPDPDNPGQGTYSAEYGKLSKGFGISQRFELAEPPKPNTDAYRKALAQVRGKGIKPDLMGTLPAGIVGRTPEETIIGIFWAYDGVANLGTPPRLYNKIIRKIAMKKCNSVSDNARLFAFVNVAMADAGILAWEHKYRYEFWRPVLGVREDTSAGDPFWLPLGAPNTNRIAKNFTPAFPAYPSGHASFGAAAFHITRLFYEEGGLYRKNSICDDTLLAGLDITSDELNGISMDNTGTVRPKIVRTFPGGLWQMIQENGLSRVFLGVHWIFDAFMLKGNGEPDIYMKDDDGNPFGGVPLGLQIAENIFSEGACLAPKKPRGG